MPATAVPLVVAYFTVTLLVEEAERLTTNVALMLPDDGLVTVALFTETVGTTAGLLIVTVACVVPMVALVGEERATVKAVEDFRALSARIVIGIVWEVTPGANVIVPLAAV